MSQSGKLVPDVDQHHQSTKILNLTVLQRIDPLVDEILLTVAHVTLYGFNLDLLQWSRKDVEGPLFVVKRNTQPRFQFIVMNRRNTDNLVEDLLGDFEYDVQVPYLLYRNATQEVNGIWFYNEHDCEAVANLLSRIVNAYSKVPPESKVSSTKSDFDEAEAAPTKAVMEGSAIPHAPEDSFLKFFSAATSIGNESKPHQPRASVPMYSHASISSMSTLSSTPLMPPFIEPIESRPTNLIKPSLFTPPPLSRPTMPISSSTPYTPLLRHPYDAPLLQPLPPAAPMITRERVRDALSRLVQNNQFIDMVYHEMLSAHYS